MVSTSKKVRAFIIFLANKVIDSIAALWDEFAAKHFAKKAPASVAKPRRRRVVSTESKSERKPYPEMVLFLMFWNQHGEIHAVPDPKLGSSLRRTTNPRPA